MSTETCAAVAASLQSSTKQAASTAGKEGKGEDCAHQDSF